MTFADRVPVGVGLEPRRLFCLRHHGWVLVYEAAHGARTDAEHRYLNPETYVCGECGGHLASDGVEVLP